MMAIGYNINMKEIIYYTTEDGKCPYIKWLESLSLDYQLRIDKRINKLKDGLKGDWKHLSNSKLSELRLDFGKGYRIYYKELNNVIILLITGSDKKEQKQTIKQAESYFEDFIKRNTKG